MNKEQLAEIRRYKRKISLFKNFLWECHQSFPEYSCTTIWTIEEFEKYSKSFNKEIKGKSKYDNTTLVSEYLLKGQEFYVIQDEYSSYENGCESWDYAIAVDLGHHHFYIMSDSGSN